MPEVPSSAYCDLDALRHAAPDHGISVAPGGRPLRPPAAKMGG